MILNKFTEKTIEIFIENGIISREDKDLYVYGLYQGIIILINLLSSLLIGLLFGMLWQTIIFMLCYIPLRTYAGGYHAKTQFRCYLISIGILIVALLMIKQFIFSSWMSVAIILISGVLLFCLAPVESSNKPLNNEWERRKYKLIACKIWLIEAVCLTIVTYLNFTVPCICVIISISFFSIMLIMGEIVEKHTYEKKD